jgi:hypothetical protein
VFPLLPPLLLLPLLLLPLLLLPLLLLAAPSCMGQVAYDGQHWRDHRPGGLQPLRGKQQQQPAAVLAGSSDGGQQCQQAAGRSSIRSTSTSSSSSHASRARDHQYSSKQQPRVRIPCSADESQTVS